MMKIESNTNINPQPINEPSRLNRSFNLTGAVVMGAGLIIGVGLFTVSTNAVGFLGPTLLFSNLIALVVSILTSLIYAELSSMWPYSGGSYAYANESWGKLGKFFGFISAWVVVGIFSFIAAEALAFSYYFLSTLDFLGWWEIMRNGEAPYGVSATLATVLILTFTFVNWYGTKNVALSQKVVMFTMWGIMALAIISISFNGLNPSNYHPFIPEYFSSSNFALATTMIWWAYAGQEVIANMAEEIKFPRINVPRALILVPFVVFAVTTTMQWVVVGLLPDAQILQTASAPFAEALQIAGAGLFIFLLFMFAQFAGNFSTINPLITSCSRALFALGRNGYLPAKFGKLSSRKTPAFAVIIAGLAAIILVSSSSLQIIAEYAAFLFLFLYGFSALTLIVARFTRPEVERTFKVPLFPLTPIAVLCFVIWMISGLSNEVIIGGLGWIGLAAIFYLIWTRLPWGREERQQSNLFEVQEKAVPTPNEEEKKLLDKEFRSFSIKLGSVVVICLLFYGLTYLLG